jgi:hypothetical protein
MNVPHRSPSGRPDENEYPEYARIYVDRVRGDDAVEALSESESETVALLGPLEEDKVSGLTYAPGKWTLKQVLGHVIDCERVFAYRALCIARGEAASLPGFDQEAYAAVADAESRSLASLLVEYHAVREASMALFKTLSPEAWTRRGKANELSVTVRGLAFQIPGHELHHLAILRERYLSQLDKPSD